MQAARWADTASSPIDLDHLARQTLGDPAIRREVLDLFVAEMSAARGQLVGSGQCNRAELAHRIKGAARGIGANPVAETAAALEAEPDRIELTAALLVRMHEAMCFITEQALDKD